MPKRLKTKLNEAVTILMIHNLITDDQAQAIIDAIAKGKKKS